MFTNNSFTEEAMKYLLQDMLKYTHSTRMCLAVSGGRQKGRLVYTW